MSSNLVRAPEFLLDGLDFGRNAGVFRWDFDVELGKPLPRDFSSGIVLNNSNPYIVKWKDQYLFRCFDGDVEIRSDCWTQDRKSFWLSLGDKKNFDNAHVYYKHYLPKIIEVLGAPYESNDEEYCPGTNWVFEDGISVGFSVNERFTHYVSLVVSKQAQQAILKKSVWQRLLGL